MSSSILSKEEFEELWDILASGDSPMNLRYIKYLFSGRSDAVQIISNVLDTFSQKNIPLEVLIIQGERGVGKTFTAFYLMSYIKERAFYQILPVYISFDRISSSLDFVSKLFYDIAFGLIQYIEEESYREQLRSIMERFGVDITYAKINPHEADAPIGLLSELCKIADDHGVKLCIILDELDLLADATSAQKIYACFERLLGFQNNTRIPKLYVFCATSRALEEIENLRGSGFISRIWSALKNAKRIYLSQLNDTEKKEITEKILEIYKKCYGIDVNIAFPLLIKIIEKSLKERYLPREVITETIEVIKEYNSIKDLLERIRMQTSSISVGRDIDSILKNKLLPQISRLFPDIKFQRLANIMFPSVLFPDKTRNIDGEFVFLDDFRLGIEIKYSETKAALDNIAIDQLMSYLSARQKENIKAEAIFILLGKYDRNPFTTDQLDLLRNYGFYEKIHVFVSPIGGIFDQNLRQLILSARIAEPTQLSDILLLVLRALDILPFLRKLREEHKVGRGEGEEERVQLIQPIRNIKLRDFLKKAKGKIKGLGQKTIEKLEKAGVEYVEEFINTDANQIFQKLKEMGYRSIPKPYKIREWQKAIQELIYTQARLL